MIRDQTSLFQESKPERMELRFKAPDYATWKKEAAACDKNNGNDKDGSIPVRNKYPRHPPPRFELAEGLDYKKIDKV